MNFLQSPAWARFQESLGREVFEDAGEGWSYLAILERGKGNTRLYCPYGPEASSTEALKAALTSLEQLARTLKVTFLRIEPTDPAHLSYIQNSGWKKASYVILNPEHTRIVDLSREKDDIVAAMSQPARNIYRNYAKKGVEVKTSNDPKDIHIFLSLIHQVSERTGMRPHSDDYFRRQALALLPSEDATLWYASLNNKPIAAAITYDSDNTRYYAHAAADLSGEYRKLNAATCIVTESILNAKDKGLTQFDLYGIAPEGSPASHPWYGFTKFKRSFGGSDADFCGTWDKPLNALAYYIYRLYQKVTH